MVIKFLSPKDSDEIHTMRTESNNIEIMTSDETDETMKEHFETLLQKY